MSAGRGAVDAVASRGVDAEPYDVVDAARERLGAEMPAAGYEGTYIECPGCVRLVHQAARPDHAASCVALRSLVLYEAFADAGRRDRVTAETDAAQPARMSGGAH